MARIIIAGVSQAAREQLSRLLASSGFDAEGGAASRVYALPFTDTIAAEANPQPNAMTAIRRIATRRIPRDSEITFTTPVIFPRLPDKDS